MHIAMAVSVGYWGSQKKKKMMMMMMILTTIISVIVTAAITNIIFVMGEQRALGLGLRSWS